MSNEKEAGKLVRDPELKAMEAIARAFDGLDESSQSRVMNWAYSRWGSNRAIQHIKELLRQGIPVEGEVT